MAYDLAERVDVVKAMHAWLKIQDIAEVEWGPIFATAAGIEVRKNAHGETLPAVLGQHLMSEFMRGAIYGK
jgi:hypothetical protein